MQRASGINAGERVSDVVLFSQVGTLILCISVYWFESYHFFGQSGTGSCPEAVLSTMRLALTSYPWTITQARIWNKEGIGFCNAL